MRKVLNITNHELTKDQIVDLRATLGVQEEDIQQLTDDLKQKFSAVKIETYQRHLEEIINYAKNHLVSGDVAIVQGQMGYTYRIIQELKNYGVMCVFSFTDRVSTETQKEDGSVEKTSVFKHIQFIEY